MIKKFLAFFIVVSLVSCTPKDIDAILGTVMESGALSNADIGNGLKEALSQGIGKGAKRLSAKDGYMKSAYKILLPKEFNTVITKLKGNPLTSGLAGRAEDKVLELFNRAAEDAATTAKPIFINSIKQMSFRDAKSILMGDKNAATQFLNRTTHSQLYDAFKPKIVKSLSKVDANLNAIKLWNQAITTYNSFSSKKVNPDLEDYVANKALDGLFAMVEKEELNIRNNLRSRSSDLLKKVFALQDKK